MRKPCEFLKVRAGTKKTAVSVRKTDSYVSPPRCHRSVPCPPVDPAALLRHSCRGQDPTTGSARAARHGTEPSAPGEGVGTCPTSSLRAVREQRCFGLGITNNSVATVVPGTVVPGSLCWGTPNHRWHGSKRRPLGSALHRQAEFPSPHRVPGTRLARAACVAAVWVSVGASRGRNVAVDRAVPRAVPPEVRRDVVWEAVSMSCGSTAPHVSKIHAAQFRNMQALMKLTSKTWYPKAYRLLERQKPSVQPLEWEIHPFS